MKIVTFYFLLISSFSLFLSCKNNVFHSSDDFTLNNENIQTRGIREIPFSATFFTKKIPGASPACNPDPAFSNYTVPNLQHADDAGQGTHLGLFSTTMSFCSAEIPSPDGFPYGGGTGVFVAANGDELYIAIDHGIVHLLPPGTHPVYDLYFDDPFYFTGGTGRFEGASGGGTTDSYVNLFDDNGAVIDDHQTDHVWTGTLILE